MVEDSVLSALQKATWLDGRGAESGQVSDVQQTAGLGRKERQCQLKHKNCANGANLRALGLVNKWAAANVNNAPEKAKGASVWK